MAEDGRHARSEGLDALGDGLPAVAFEPVEHVLVPLLQGVLVTLSPKLVVTLLQGEFRLLVGLIDAEFLPGVVACGLEFRLIDSIEVDHRLVV